MVFSGVWFSNTCFRGERYTTIISEQWKLFHWTSKKVSCRRFICRFSNRQQINRRQDIFFPERSGERYFIPVGGVVGLLTEIEWLCASGWALRFWLGVPRTCGGASVRETSIFEIIPILWTIDKSKRYFIVSIKTCQKKKHNTKIKLLPLKSTRTMCFLFFWSK